MTLQYIEFEYLQKSSTSHISRYSTSFSKVLKVFYLDHISKIGGLFFPFFPQSHWFVEYLSFAVAQCMGLVVAPGGFGTADELFELFLDFFFGILWRVKMI